LLRFFGWNGLAAYWISIPQKSFTYIPPVGESNIDRACRIYPTSHFPFVSLDLTSPELQSMIS
jgi:hypothetical protein